MQPTAPKSSGSWEAMGVLLAGGLAPPKAVPNLVRECSDEQGR